MVPRPDEGVPSGTGSPRASTSSAMHKSVAKVSTGSPGSLWPARPSVQAKELMTGTPNPAVMAVRVASVSIALVPATDCGAMRRAGPLLGGQLREPGGVADQHGRLHGIEPLDGLGEREGGGHRYHLDRAAAGGGRDEPAGVHRRGGGNHRDHHPVRWPAGGQLAGDGVAPQRGGHVGVFADRLHEHAALPGGAARGQAHVIAEQQGRLTAAAAQVVFHPAPGKPPVGGHLIEAGHHLRLGHRRQAGQVGQLEPGRIDVPEAAGVERGALDRPGQQRTQALCLVGGEPVSIPVQALQLGYQPRGELGLSAGLQAGQAGFGRHGHVVLRSVTVIMSRRPGLPGSARPAGGPAP